MDLIQVESLPNCSSSQLDGCPNILLIGGMEVSRLQDFVGREQNIACLDLAAVEERVELCDQRFTLPLFKQPTLKVVPADFCRDLVGRMNHGDSSRSDVAVQLKPPEYLPTGTQDASTTPGPACVQIQKNESATTELYLQIFHLTKRIFTNLSRTGSYAVTLGGIRSAGLSTEPL